MKKINWIAFLCVAFSTMFFNACGDSVDADEQVEIVESSSSVKCSSSNALYPESFKPNDEDYPYADIPRIVVETEYRQAIKDRETEIPAKLQIWGEKEAESEIMDLTIRGRGNSSWDVIPKKSYKIEFKKKQTILGMPKDKDWALIANYADKSLMRNFVAYRMSAAIGAYYAPRCEFAELYLNGKYLGVYLLTETIKIGENRVNIPKDEYSYIVEFDAKYKENEQVVFSDVITEDGIGKAFRVHDPKNASDAVLDSVQVHIENFENFLKTIKRDTDNNVENWIDVEESIKHYWVQEITKNPDAGFYTSVYFSWVKGEKIKMGPVWDFDLAFGNAVDESLNTSESLIIRGCYWNKYLFKDSLYERMIDDVWVKKRTLFVDFLDSIDIIRNELKKSAQNNFNKWNILEDDSAPWHPKPYKTYDEAVDDLKEWLSERIQWIDAFVKDE